MDRVRIKLVKNEGSVNVISNEDSYKAKGIKSRDLEGEEYEYAYLGQHDIQVLAKHVAKELRNIRKNKKKKIDNNNVKDS